jgi:transporter family protein
MSWLVYAMLSAIAAAATAVLAKLGVEAVPSTLATAIRTVVIVIFAWLMVFVTGESRVVTSIPRRSMMFLVLSGIGTGVSWPAYFRALQLGPAALMVVGALLTIA